MDPSGYAFILTAIEPKIDTPYEIIPRHTLERAIPEQVIVLKSTLERFNTDISSLLHPPYEFNVKIVQGERPGQRNYEFKKLKTEDWRYWIISFEPNNHEMMNLGYALSLMENDIELGFEIIGKDAKNVGFAWHAQSLHTFFNDRIRGQLPPKPILEEDLLLAAHCYEKLLSLPKEYQHISRSFRLFDNLRSIPLLSRLAILGLFSALESLLTHAPDPKDPSDSLARQIKHKVALIQKRFVRDLDYKKWFDNIKEENLWKKLYLYRSLVAHGEKAHISGKLEELKSTESVVSFLREVLKLLLAEALDEPELITDLKEC